MNVFNILRRVFFRIIHYIRKIHYFYFPVKPVTYKGNERATAIILNFKRPQNITPIIKHLLKCDFIEKVVCSNNNPAIDIDCYLKIEDDRLEVIKNKEVTPVRSRWIIANKLKSEYFIAIDDDLFISTKQLLKLFKSLVNDPEHVHGVFGTVHDVVLNRLSDYIGYIHKESNQSVDIIHQIYAVTDKHVKQYFQLMKEVELTYPEVYQYLQVFGDDIIMSHSALSKALIHNIGPVLECPTCHSEGISQFKRENFHQHRKEIFKTIKKITSN